MSVQPPGEVVEPDRPVEKGTLFCLSCPYRDAIDGAWTVVETNDSVHYLCPNCGTGLPARRRLSGDASERPQRPVLDGPGR
ncbi:small CPxCG-related zinc finger protein [Natronomonas moolapensis 8.8.11]|uniref:Small CPxCG-related zinc finger protein n=1 Tax=Natronomonas moolapensis (strain DSM 18674 / CECT 7526 / JCM 14361 / 8.8.11) TaxID=268739 RepID=M1XQN7_NATM8|nr:hypothetical protein [Natronomonas moolapensis]CCQ36462.1 small CPxCG-related zinc finger protein [Natronomonas moolapensis 8.8.11]